VEKINISGGSSHTISFFADSTTFEATANASVTLSTTTFPAIATNCLFYAYKAIPKIYDGHAFLTLKIVDILHHFERRPCALFFGGP
jgi:hypothetical protein